LNDVTVNSLYVAVDLGAGSGRVFVVDLSEAVMELSEVRRFSYPAALSDGFLRWDFPRILEEIKTGLASASAYAGQQGRTIYSVGVDSWGVDYGLIDAESRLIEDPVCYRDHRTDDVMARVFDLVPRDEIFDRTGNQFLPINTIFQLAAHADHIPAQASRLLMIPDLVNFCLTGRRTNEYTNATTTQLINSKTGTWDIELIDRLGLPSRLFGELITPGTELGLLTPSLADELSLHGVRVIAPATHDTGSAVAGTPLDDGWAYISSGTWSLVGVELWSPLINERVAKSNCTNEGGASNTIRFLKNLTGLWILESCRREWVSQGLDIDYDSLLDDVASLEAFGPVVFPDDRRFFNPRSMLDAIAEQLSENGCSNQSNKPAAITKIILDSLALRYASVVRTIESLSGIAIKGIHIVGGGALNDYLNQATSNASGLPVKAGPVEATVIGNAIVQAIAAGRFGSLREARRFVGDHIELKAYEPRQTELWRSAGEKYRSIEGRYLEAQE
jgi:rhamnulokinase